MIILIILAAVVTGAPLLAAVLVSIASLREDAEQSLGGRAPGWLTAAARRLLRADLAGSRRRDVPRLPRQRQPGHDDVAPVRGERTPDNHDDATRPMTFQ